MQDETPSDMWPGIGLRPGENRPDLEDFIIRSYRALYTSIADHSKKGVSVVVDVGHHDRYSRPLEILPDCMRLLADLPVMVVGVLCELKEILKRRAASGEDYLSEIQTDDDLSPVHLWQEAVHEPGIYDLEVDTTHHSATDCVQQIREFLDRGSPCYAARTLATLNCT